MSNYFASISWLFTTYLTNFHISFYWIDQTGQVCPEPRPPPAFSMEEDLHPSIPRKETSVNPDVNQVHLIFYQSLFCLEQQK